MANFYLDTPELKKHLQHPLMERIITLKEREFSEKDAYAYAPKDVQDAQDNYDRVLEIVGEVCGDIIAPNAEGVDNEKPVCANGRVSYASGTAQNLQACRQAGLMGMSMPRRLGGLNFPLLHILWQQTWYLVVMLDLRTFGVFKTVLKQYTNLAAKNKNKNISLVSAKVKQ